MFSVYLLDEEREELSIAYAVGYPEEIVKHFTLKVGQGTVGTAVAEQRPILLNDVDADPRYLAVVPGAKSQLAVPLRNKGQVIGALNLLSDKLGAFTERDEWILRQFGAHVAQAIATARLFESEREYAETLETLAEIGREMSAILDPDELLTQARPPDQARRSTTASSASRCSNEETQMLELKVTIKYGDDPRAMEPVKLGEGLVGYAALHKEVVLVPDVTKDPRYIDAVPGVRSELVVPLLLKDRCIGVFDLESPERDAFNKKHVKLLTLLASEAAVAIENARLYESIRANEARFEKELRSRSACRWRCCRRSCRSACAAWMWPGISIRRASSAATSATSCRRNRTRWWSRSATCRARACRRRSTARRSARWCAAARSGAGSRRRAARRPACSRA